MDILLKPWLPQNFDRWCQWDKFPPNAFFGSVTAPFVVGKVLSLDSRPKENATPIAYHVVWQA